MTDDQRVDEMAVLPAVRRLIVRPGAWFTRSFASFPLCCPSRATFLTGQYAHNHGVLDNRPPRGGYYKLDSDETLPVWLQRAGYETAHVGKYLNGYGTRRPARGAARLGRVARRDRSHDLLLPRLHAERERARGAPAALPDRRADRRARCASCAVPSRRSS